MAPPGRGAQLLLSFEAVSQHAKRTPACPVRGPTRQICTSFENATSSLKAGSRKLTSVGPLVLDKRRYRTRENRTRTAHRHFTVDMWHSYRAFTAGNR